MVFGHSEKSIAILGATQSGKTVYLAILSRALEAMDGIEGQDYDRITYDFLSKVLNYMYKNKEYPPPTPPSTKQMISLKYRTGGLLKERIGKKIKINTYDISGEDILSLSEPFKELTSVSKGFLIMLDPDPGKAVEQDYLMYNAFHEIRDKYGKNVNAPIAFILTKADQYRNISDAQPYFRQTFTHTAKQDYIKIKYKEFFKCSATGHDLRTLKEEPRAEHVIEPLFWVLEHMK